MLTDSQIIKVKEIHYLLDTPLAEDSLEEVIVNELFTVQDVVRFCVSVFAAEHIYVGHGTENYWDEAVELVQAVMHLQPPCDDSTLQSRLTVRERRVIAEILKLRVFERIPLPYLTHRAFFCGREFYVDHRVIIPRSPIAELIERGFDPYIDRQPDRVLDMCTGSGCIAIATALHFEGEVEVDAVDISPDALEVANINISANGLENVVTPIESDLFAALPKGPLYDLIIANPPYVNEEDLESMPEEYHSEPDLALGSGRDGLNCARRILAEAADYMTEDGILFMEVGNSEEDLNEAFPLVPFHFVDLKKGGRGVFLLTADQLKAYADVFKAAARADREREQ